MIFDHWSLDLQISSVLKDLFKHEDLIIYIVNPWVIGCEPKDPFLPTAGLDEALEVHGSLQLWVAFDHDLDLLKLSQLPLLVELVNGELESFYWRH